MASVQRFVAFLRGVNVGGRVVRKDVLLGIFRDAGLKNARTHIASGNVSFDAPPGLKRPALTRTLEQRLLERAGYPIPVFLRSTAQLERVLAVDPFENLRLTARMRPCVIFISSPLPPGARLPYRAPRGEFDLLLATPGEVYAIMNVIGGRPGNPSAYVEKTYGVAATTRFFESTAKILAAALAP